MAQQRLLTTDLDGTFIGDDEAMFALWDALCEKGIMVAFSTGRHLESIRDFYAEKGAERRADACVCMVGTDIWLREDGEYRLDEAWHERIAYRWDKASVEKILAEIPEAAMQEQQWQSRFKSSYFLEENADERLRQIHERLAAEGLEAKVVYSADRFLDLLPIRSGKGEAVKYLAKRLNLPPENVITCGDTGNDIDMMRPELGFRGIVVANARPELKALDGPHIYHAPAPYAAGIHAVLKEIGWL